MPSKSKPRKPKVTSMKLLPEDQVLIESLRQKFNLEGLPNSQVVRLVLRRVAEERAA